MARPKKHNAEYFTHDSNMRNHRKMRALGTKFGIAGYGVWCVLLEMLTEADHNRIDLTDEMDWVLRTPEFFGVSDAEIKQIIDYCCRIGLLSTVKENRREYLFSDGLNDRLAMVYEKRNQAREAYAKKGEKEVKNISATETPISATETPILSTETLFSVAENTQSKVKESKVKESTLNKVECSINTATHTTLKSNLFAGQILPKLAEDAHYLHSIAATKNCTEENIKILYQYFQSVQVEEGREYPSEKEARKHFSKWYDFTASDHGKFIAIQQKRNAFAQKQNQPKPQRPSVTVADVNALVTKIQARIVLVQQCTYTTTDAIIQESRGIIVAAQQLAEMGAQIPAQKAAIEANVRYINTLANQFMLAPATYLKPAQEPSAAKIDEPKK